MDIKIGDRLNGRINNSIIEYCVIDKGTSFGYNLVSIEGYYYDVLPKLDKDGYLDIDKDFISYKYQVDDSKVLKNGEICTLLCKYEDGSCLLGFDNGKKLKFVSVFAFHNRYATSEREDGKEYDINVGDIVTCTHGMKGIVKNINSLEITIEVEGVEAKFPIKYTGQRKKWVLDKDTLARLLVGKERIVNGTKMKIKKVNNIKDLEVELDTGEVRVMSYTGFMGATRAIKNQHIVGLKVYQQKEKMYAECIQSTGAYLLIKFDDGTTSNALRQTFMEGKSTKVLRNRFKVKVGESIVQNNGLVATVLRIYDNYTGDVQLSDGTVLKNVKLGRFREGSLSSGVEIAYNNKFEQKRMNKRYDCVCGLYYHIVGYTKEEITVRWNDSYCETIDRGKVAYIKVPRCFITYKGKLRYKNIVIERVESNKDKESLIVHGNCATCGEPVVLDIMENMYGHNCMNKVSKDSLGVPILVEHIGYQRYSIIYEDGSRAKSINLEKGQGTNCKIYHPELYCVCGNFYMYSCRDKVLSMYFDNTIGKYRVLAESKIKERKIKTIGRGIKNGRNISYSYFYE